MEHQLQTLAEHMARYAFAKKHTVGKVADMACGTGYGSEMLEADGYDIAPEAIGYARTHYKGEFGILDLSDPKLDKTYDTVVSFETIEHLENPHPFLEWVKGHTKRFIFSIPVNNPSRFHKQVYSVEQIKGLMNKYFPKVKWFSQKGSEIKELSNECPTFIVGITE